MLAVCEHSFWHAHIVIIIYTRLYIIASSGKRHGNDNQTFISVFKLKAKKISRLRITDLMWRKCPLRMASRMEKFFHVITSSWDASTSTSASTYTSTSTYMYTYTHTYEYIYRYIYRYIYIYTYTCIIHPMTPTTSWIITCDFITISVDMSSLTEVPQCPLTRLGANGCTHGIYATFLYMQTRTSFQFIQYFSGYKDTHYKYKVVDI